MTIKDLVDRTYFYGSLFDFPLTPSELHFWLTTSKRNRPEDIPANLIKKLSKSEIQKRKLRLKNSDNKKKYALLNLEFIKKIPLVWFVGITGSVSANNSKASDDIDIFIITAPHTLWLIRPIILFYLELLGIRRKRNSHHRKVKNLICPNLWLDANNLYLDVDRQNIYTAHEVLQVYPLINKHNSYQIFICKNSWIKNFLANSYPRISKNSYPSNFLYLLFYPFNLCFFLFQYLFMLSHSRGEEVALGKAFFHDPVFQNKILKSLT